MSEKPCNFCRVARWLQFITLGSVLATGAAQVLYANWRLERNEKEHTTIFQHLEMQSERLQALSITTARLADAVGLDKNKTQPRN